MATGFQLPTATTQLLVAAVMLIVALIVAGMFVKPGTYRVGIEVMDKIISAYRVAEALDERKRVELVEQLRLTELERDSVKKTLADEQARSNRLERLLANLTLEQDMWNAAQRTMQARITQLETLVADLQAQLKGKSP